MASSDTNPTVSSAAPPSRAPANGDSLGRRYIFKLLSNIATIPLFFALEAVLPRALGPAGYGNYNFASNVFLQFTNLLDMGTSTCLTTAISKRQDEFGLVAFYSRISLGMLVLCLLAGAMMYIPAIGNLLMPDVPLWMALPSALLSYIAWAGKVTRGMNDALGITARSELTRMAVNLMSAVAIVTLFYGGWLSLPTLFAHQYASYGALLAGFIFSMRMNWLPRIWALTSTQNRDYVKEFRIYSGPLFIMALSSALILSAERWMLQYFDGSVEQGYFSLSQKVGQACFLFVTAMTPLLMRELAVAHGRKDPQAMGKLIDRFAPLLYAVAAWFSCFTLMEAPAVVRIFGGSQFTDALLPVQIMALYPLHQGYGQIANSVYYATGETRALRNVTLWTLVGGMGVTWALLAPSDMFGLHLGAVGLALKMVGMQFLAVNILLLACRKIIPFNYPRNLLHQVLCPAALLGLAAFTRWSSAILGFGDYEDYSRFFASGVLYALLSLLLALSLPFIFGIRQGEMRIQAQRLWEWLQQRAVTKK